MHSINIDKNTLIAIIVIAIIIFILIMYYNKRKFDSIDKYNENKSDKPKTYKENQEQYEKNLDDLGIKSKKETRTILQKIKSIIDIFRGSK